MLARDFMALKLWDLHMESRALWPPTPSTSTCAGGCVSGALGVKVLQGATSSLVPPCVGDTHPCAHDTCAREAPPRAICPARASKRHEGNIRRRCSPL